MSARIWRRSVIIRLVKVALALRIDGSRPCPTQAWPSAGPRLLDPRVLRDEGSSGRCALHSESGNSGLLSGLRPDARLPVDVRWIRVGVAPLPIVGPQALIKPTDLSFSRLSHATVKRCGGRRCATRIGATSRSRSLARQRGSATWSGLAGGPGRSPSMFCMGVATRTTTVRIGVASC
jgi:hypothetical protein